MLKELIAGISVGIANAIPGVSGGTMLVISGVFEKMTTSVSNVLSKNKKDQKEAITFLLKLGLGVAIGIIVFAKLLNSILFRHIPTQTIFWFMGMVAFSVPVFLRREMKAQKLNWIPFILGLAVIAVISYFAPPKTSIELDQLPNIDILHLCTMILIGLIGGFAMIIPGVSGSMILLIIGKYYLFTTYIAKITTFRFDVILSLGFIVIGILIGIVTSSKLCKYLFKVAPKQTNSFILGLILASAIALFPINTLSLDIISIITYFIAFIFGAFLVWLMDKYA